MVGEAEAILDSCLWALGVGNMIIIFQFGIVLKARLYLAGSFFLVNLQLQHLSCFTNLY